MKKVCLWLWLLTKRLYKRPVFLALLVLIPVLTACYHVTTHSKSGVMTVALAQAGEDGTARQMMEQLGNSDGLLQYRICDSVTQAQLLVSTGKVDAAWIFPADTVSRIDAFLEDPHGADPVVTVLQREDNVAHMLAREKLSGQVYQVLAQRFYLAYLRQNFQELAPLSDETLMGYYDSVEMEGSLFEYRSITGEQAPVTHYLLQPVRGMLGILAVLAGMAAAMYYEKDRQLGTFSYVPQRLGFLPELGCQTVTVGNVAAVSLVALMAAGLSGNVLREVLLLALYTLCVAVFCMLLRSVTGGSKVLGGLMPVLVVLMLLICPVFVDLAQLRLLQLLLPPTYYIIGAHNPMYLLYMVVYTCLCGMLFLLAEKRIRKWR